MLPSPKDRVLYLQFRFIVNPIPRVRSVTFVWLMSKIVYILLYFQTIIRYILSNLVIDYPQLKSQDVVGY